MTVLKAGREVIQAIVLAYEADLSVMLSGRHGVGKSELFKQAAEELEIDFIVRDLSLMEPPDLLGVPHVVNGRTVYAAPATLPSGGRGLFAIEELNRCAHYMRAPCLQLLTERRLNDYILPENWMPVAAINPSDVEYHVDQLDPALVSRFVQLHIVPDAHEWAKWADSEGHVGPKIRDFVRHTPGVFDDPDSNPRAWTYASQILREWETGNYTQKTLNAMMEGTVGEKWAAAFWQFYKHDRAPLAPDELIAGYTTCRATVRRWLEQCELDLVTATLQLLKDFLKVRKNYTALLENETHKKHARMFLYDLPGDVKSQMERWLKDNHLTELKIPRRPL